MIVHSNVKDGQIFFHKLPVNEERQKAWIHAVNEGKKDFEKPKHFKGSYPETMIVHSNVKDGQRVFHKLLVNEERQKAWIHAVSKRKEDFEKPKHFKVCLNHFLEGKPNR